MQVYIASDHGGFELKSEILEKHLDTKFELIDLGPFEFDPLDDYPEFAKLVAEKVSSDESTLGILICRSGIGVSIAANKFKGVYAALCFTPEHAKKARVHNNANILCLDSDYGDFKNHINIVETFLDSEFDGDGSRHDRRVQMIKDLEEENFNS